MPTPSDTPGVSGTVAASESWRSVAAFFLRMRSDVGWLDKDLPARREASWAVRASSWLSNVENGRSEGRDAGEHELCGWCSVKWRPELLRYWKSAGRVDAQLLLACQLLYSRHGLWEK